MSSKPQARITQLSLQTTIINNQILALGKGSTHENIHLSEKIIASGGSRISRRGGSQPRRWGGGGGGAPTPDAVAFRKICVKTKESGPLGGACWVHPLDPPLITDFVSVAEPVKPTPTASPSPTTTTSTSTTTQSTTPSSTSSTTTSVATPAPTVTKSTVSRQIHVNKKKLFSFSEMDLIN